MNNYNLSDVHFISIPENRKIGDIVLKSTVPLPVLIDKGTKVEDIEISSLMAGLIKVIAYQPDNENLSYYKKILLSMRSGIKSELTQAGLAKMQCKEYMFARELLLVANRLSQTPESFLNLSDLYEKMSLDASSKQDDVLSDMYDDKIAEVLNECKNLHPDYAPVYKALYVYFKNHGDLQNSKENIEKFIELTKDGSAKGQAQKILKKIEKKLSDHQTILYAYDKIMMNEPDQAVLVLDKYIENEQPSWEVFFLRGWAYRIIQNYDKAQKDLLESLHLDSENAEVYNELSICAREAGNKELAKSYLQIAIDLDEECVIYKVNLAFLYFESSDYSLCRQMIEKARILDSEDPQLQYVIGMYEEKTGEKISCLVSEEIKSDEQIRLLNSKGYKEI